MNYELARLIVSVLTLLVLPASICIAYRNLRNIQRKNEKDDIHRYDKELVAQCVISLERAYEALGDIDASSGLPAPNRVNWLTSARMIMRYYSLKSSIVSDLYKLVCEEHEEYWRHRFYRTLDANLLLEKYFSPNLDKTDPKNIDGRSALIVVTFSQWKEETVDPINEFDIEKAFQNKGMLWTFCGLKNYLSKYRQYSKLIEKERDS